MQLAALRRPSRPIRTEIPFFPFCRAVTYFSAAVTFGALVTTGELSPVVSALFMIAWPTGFLFEKAPGWWRPWHGTSITVAVIFSLAWLARRGSPFEAVLYLLLFLALAKCFTLRRSRDHLQAQVICFFMLVSTSVITQDFLFSLFFLAYVLLAILGLGLYSLSVLRERVVDAQTPSSGPARAPAQPALPTRFLRGSAGAVGLAVALVLFFFLAIPHISMQQLSSPLSRRETPAEKLIGFSDDVSFGEFKSLKPNQTVVMRVELSWPEGIPPSVPDHLRLRGVALDYYDEASWKRSPRRGFVGRDSTRQINPVIKSAQKGSSVSRNTTQRIYQNTDITTRVFAAPWPILIDLGRRLTIRLDQELGGAQVVEFGRTRESTYTNPMVYQATSNVVDEASGLLPELVAARRKERALRAEALLAGDRQERLDVYAKARAEGRGLDRLPWLAQTKNLTLSPEERLINLQLPETEMTEKIVRLAREVAPGPTQEEIVIQLLRYFRSKFSYSFQPDTPPGMHPIEAFLFKTRKGHCEYFATAFALMLRARGVPARLVNGFYTTEWNRIAELFIVKQSDAHAWTEVWLDGPGWLTLDPTPPGSAGRGGYDVAESSMFEVASEYLRIQWQRFIIDYTASKQVQFFDRVRSAPGLRSIFSAVDWARDQLGGDDPRKPKSKREAFDVSRALGDAVLLATVVGGGAFAARRIRRRSRLGRDRSGVDYFDALLDRLERDGLRRKPSQTPAEFIAAISALPALQGADAPPPRTGAPARGPSVLAPDALRWIVDLYYRQKYAGEPPTPDERKRAKELLAG